jgi:hypothetical protein
MLIQGVTLTGTYVVDTVLSPSNGSVAFNGSTQYLDIASTSAFGFGTADFTIEFWWRPTVNQRSDVLDFWSTGLGASITGRFDIGRITGSTLDLYTDSPTGGGGSGQKIIGPTIASLLNTWVHVAVTRESGSIKMWVNGTQAGSTYSAWALNMGSSMSLRIMGDHNVSGNGSGNLTNVRVVRGTAVYTATFTPPSSPLTAISGTQLLLSTTNDANFIKDSSSNNLIVTNTGPATSSAVNPFSPVTSGLVLYYNPDDTASYAGTGTTVNSLVYPKLAGTMANITYTDPYFSYNGTSSQVSIADNAALEPGSGSWTMEVWVNQNASGNDVVLGKFDPGGLAQDVSYSIRTTGTSYYAQLGSGSGSGNTLYVDSTTFAGTLNTWYQLVYVLKNGATKTLETFVNGSSIGTVNHSLASVLNTSANLYLGSYNNGEYAQWFDGKIGITRLYNAALTAEQVLQNYDANRGIYGL